LVNIIVEVNEPVLAAQYVQKSIEILQKYIVEYKTQQVRENLEFIQERFVEKKDEYEKAQFAFFEYKDSHRSVILERVDPDFQRLSDVYDIASTVYKDLARQLEAAKIAVKEQTPAFIVLEPAKVPDEKSGPPKKLILVLSVLFGVVTGLGFIFVKYSIWQFKKCL